jgi:ankyrin repeat protein
LLVGEYAEKCDLNMTDAAKRTPLHHAALRGHARIAAVLVDAGKFLRLWMRRWVDSGSYFVVTRAVVLATSLVH